VAKLPEELEVRILEVREVPTPTTDEKEALEIWLTYRYGDLPPRLVRIPKAEDTAEERKKRIRADLQKALAAAPEVMKV